MGQFYKSLASDSRPRVFGCILGAPSPSPYDDALLLTEELTLCGVFGVSPSRRQAYASQISKPSETILLYEPEGTPAQSFLYEELYSFDPREELFGVQFLTAKIM